MKKSRMEKLIPIANQVLIEQYNTVVKEHTESTETDRKKRDAILDKAILRMNNLTDFYIKKNYDGKVSAFGIAVALSGLRPALAMYFNESGDVKTRPILEAIAKIIIQDKMYTALTEATAKGLLEHALIIDDSTLKNLKKYVLEASIALKQVVRTYELV